MKLLARYRYLRSSFIRTFTERDKSSVNYSLSKLFDHGYLDKPREQRRGYNSLYSHHIYELDVKGNHELLERGIKERDITRLYRQKTDGPVKNFAHSMMICDATASIELGVRQSHCEFIGWQEIIARTSATNPMKLPCAISHTFHNTDFQRLQSFVIPDGLFGIRYPDNQVSFFALEAEHYNPIYPTNLHRSSFLKKLLAYRDVIKSGVYKSQLKLPNLRVLVVAPTPARISSMIELTKQITGGTNLFLFSDVPVQEEIFKAPPPFPELFTSEWKRAGRDSVRIDTA
jgi:DNA-binding PadR family transcriptional regulator